MKIKHISGFFIENFTVTLKVDGKYIRRMVHFTKKDGEYVIIQGQRVTKDMIMVK